jgi:hypothetical protein
MSWLHNEPHDYYRYTPHGLRFLLTAAGLRDEKIVPAGGLLSLLGHIVSMLMVNLTFGLPLVHTPIMAVNRLMVRGVAKVDAFFEKRKIFALNYVVLAKKL